jgi:hypothetical protein
MPKVKKDSVAHGARLSTEAAVLTKTSAGGQAMSDVVSPDLIVSEMERIKDSAEVAAGGEQLKPNFPALTAQQMAVSRCLCSRALAVANTFATGRQSRGAQSSGSCPPVHPPPQRVGECDEADCGSP